MINSYKAKHFEIRELVPEVVFASRGDKAWQLIDLRLIANADALREQLGVPLTCNNWHTGGARKASGLRVVGQSEWTDYSQHTFGRAIDIVCSIPAVEIRQAIKDKAIVLPHPACFEELDGMSWLHMDVRNMSNAHTYFFKP